MKKKLVGFSVIASCLVLSLAFLSGCAADEYTMELTVPPSDEVTDVSNDTVLIAQGDKITVEPSAEVSDGTVTLVSAVAGSKDDSEAVYVTHGAPVSFEVNEGTEYRLIYETMNDTDEELTVKFVISGVKTK